MNFLPENLKEGGDRRKQLNSCLDIDYLNNKTPLFGTVFVRDIRTTKNNLFNIFFLRKKNH